MYITQNFKIKIMTKRIQIESTLAKIANVVFETKDFKLAQQTALDHLAESSIKESDRLKMIDEILLGKKSNSNDVVKKTKEEDEDEKSPISKILMRNIESIKKIAEREGLSLNKLIKHFKESE